MTCGSLVTFGPDPALVHPKEVVNPGIYSLPTLFYVLGLTQGCSRVPPVAPLQPFCQR